VPDRVKLVALKSPQQLLGFMSYIENNLMHDERLVHHTRLHPIILTLPAAATSLFAGTLPMVWDQVILWVPIAICLVYSLFRLVDRLILFLSSEYGITSKRVLGKTGLIRRHSLDIVLAKVEAVRLKQNILGRILNYGHLEVTGTGGTEELLKFIPDPLTFRNVIQEQLWNLHGDRNGNGVDALDL